MKSISKLITAITVLGALVSCNGFGDLPEVILIEEPYDVNSVSLNVVNTYITAVKGIPRTKAVETEVTPVFHDGDTVMYLVNYPEGGWELLSADKRVPTRLMVGEEGSMSLSEIEEHPGMSILLNDMRNQISAVKRSSQEEPVTEKGILWDDIAPMTENARSITWLQIGQDTEYLDSVYVGHLITTNWDQSDSVRFYNKYVPFLDSEKVDSSHRHCLAGCVPVAVGQVAAYLNKKFGFTTSCRFLQLNCQTYLSGIGSTTSYGPFVPATSTYVSDNNLYWRWVRGETWPQENIDNAVAVLLAFLGWKLESIYSHTLTDTTFEYVEDTFESEYGVYCTCDQWDTSDAISEIVNRRMPVIVGAYSTNIRLGHAWIIDGYYHCTTLINRYYQGFDTSNPSTPLYKTVQEMIEEEYLLMNWGFGGLGRNATYMVDSSTWTIEGVTFDLKREMIYGFSKL